MLAAVGSLTMRVFRALGLTTLGAFAGFTGAAALFKRAVPSRGGAESDDVALVAIFRRGERAITVFAALVPLLLVVAFVLAELIVGHD